MSVPHCVCYFLEEGIAYFSHEPYFNGFLFQNPSECRWFIPGTYAEMMKDYA